MSTSNLYSHYPPIQQRPDRNLILSLISHNVLVTQGFGATPLHSNSAPLNLETVSPKSYTASQAIESAPQALTLERVAPTAVPKPSSSAIESPPQARTVENTSNTALHALKSDAAAFMSASMVAHRAPGAEFHYTEEDVETTYVILYLLRYGTLTGIGHVAMLPMTPRTYHTPQLVISVAILSKFLVASTGEQTTYSQSRLRRVLKTLKAVPFKGSPSESLQFYSACCAEFGVPEGKCTRIKNATASYRQQKFVLLAETAFYSGLKNVLTNIYKGQDIPFKRLFVPDLSSSTTQTRKNQYKIIPFSPQCVNGQMWPNSKIRGYTNFQKRKYEFVQKHTPWATAMPWTIHHDKHVHLDQDFIPHIVDDVVYRAANDVVPCADEKQVMGSVPSHWCATSPPPKKAKLNPGETQNDNESESESESESDGATY